MVGSAPKLMFGDLILIFWLVKSPFVDSRGHQTDEKNIFSRMSSMMLTL